MHLLALGCGATGLLLAPALDTLARRTVDAPAATTAVRASTALLTGALAALLALRPGPLLPASLWLLGLAVVLATTDLTTRRLPNALLGPGALGLAVLLGVGAVLDGRDLRGAVVASAVLLLGFLAVALAVPAGLGMGDVKLVGVLGLPLGLAGAGAVLAAVVLALTAHAVVSLALLASRRVGLRTALPLGPALLAGTAAALGWFSPLLG